MLIQDLAEPRNGIQVFNTNAGVVGNGLVAQSHPLRYPNPVQLGPQDQLYQNHGLPAMV